MSLTTTASSPFSRSLPATVLDRAARHARRRTPRASDRGAARPPAPPEHVGGCLELQAQMLAAGLLELAVGRLRWAGSPPRRRPSAARHRRRTPRLHASASWAAVATSRQVTPGGWGSDTLAATTVTLAPRARAASANAKPHAPRGAVADEAHAVDRLTGAAGGDEHAQALPGAAWRGGGACGRVGWIGARSGIRDRSRRHSPAARVPVSANASQSSSSCAGSGRRPGHRSPREASLPSSGSITLTPRSRSVSRLAWIAGSGTCGCSSRERPPAGGGSEGGPVSILSAGPWRASPPCWPRPARSGRGRRWRPARGGRSDRAWAALGRGRRRARVALELGDQHRRAGERLKRGGAHEAAGSRSSAPRTPWPATRRQPHELQRLVGGDPTAYPEQDSCHTPLEASGVAPRKRRRLGVSRYWYLILPSAISSRATVR